MVVVVAEIELEVGENFARGGVCVWKRESGEP